MVRYTQRELRITNMAVNEKPTKEPCCRGACRKPGDSVTNPCCGMATYAYNKPRVFDLQPYWLIHAFSTTNTELFDKLFSKSGFLQVVNVCAYNGLSGSVREGQRWP